MPSQIYKLHATLQQDWCNFSMRFLHTHTCILFSRIHVHIGKLICSYFVSLPLILPDPITSNCVAWNWFRVSTSIFITSSIASSLSIIFTNFQGTEAKKCSPPPQQYLRVYTVFLCSPCVNYIYKFFRTRIRCVYNRAQERIFFIGWCVLREKCVRVRSPKIFRNFFVYYTPAGVVFYMMFFFTLTKFFLCDVWKRSFFFFFGMFFFSLLL